MQFVWWLTGVCVVIGCCRFVLLVFKRLTSRENMNDLIDRASDGFHNAAERVADSIKQKREKKKDEKRPIVTIR